MQQIAAIDHQCLTLTENVNPDKTEKAMLIAKCVTKYVLQAGFFKSIFFCTKILINSSFFHLI